MSRRFRRVVPKLVVAVAMLGTACGGRGASPTEPGASASSRASPSVQPPTTTRPSTQATARPTAVVTAATPTSARMPTTPAPGPDPRPGLRACPAYPAMPGAGCTGVPAGTFLTPVRGTVTVTGAGTVIEDKDVSGCILVKASNVTIRRTRVRSASCENQHQIDVGYTGISGVLIEDVEIDGLGTSGFGAAVGNSGFTCRRCNIHNVGQGVNMSDDVVVEDSWIHDLVSEGDPARGGSHNEAVVSNGGSNLTVRHNLLDGETSNASSALSLYGDFDPIADVLVTQNLFNGGGFCVYAGSVAGKPHPMATNTRFVDNRFGQKYHPGCGSYGPVTGFQAGAGNAWAGNVWDATGSAVTV